MSSDTRLYFVAVVIAGEAGEQVTRVKEEFRERYKVERALRSPPHITLVPPFRSDDLPNIQQAVDEVNRTLKPFRVVLNGFGHFGERVIFVKPELNDELTQYYTRCREVFGRAVYGAAYERAFHPHVTVAFRDLTPETFRIAWPEYKDRTFYAEIMVSHLFLLRLEEKGWKVVE